MGTINVSSLTMNPKEVEDFSAFVLEKTFESPLLNSLHVVNTGVKMKEQIVLASQFGHTGLLSTGCDAVSSGAGTVLSQKYWEPKKIEDRFELCQTDVDGLFKAYYTKINAYKDLYDNTGSDEAIFLTTLTEESMNRTIGRAVWLADKDVALATSGTSGIATGETTSGNTVFYNYFDGIWAQAFDEVTSGNTARYTISANTGTTIAAQELAAGEAKTILSKVYKQADSRLRSDSTKKFYVSRNVYENYVDSLIEAGENSTIEYTLEGLPTVKYRGVDVVNMETLWDINLEADFVQNTTTEAHYLPNRVMLTTPANIPVATLNDGDLSMVDSFYDKYIRKNILDYGFTLESKLVSGYMASVAY